jgi:hypothetical protein
MAQHDMNIANQGFPAFRSDLNNALSAIQTNHSGTSRPTGAVAGQIWLDTTSATNPTLKFFDGTDDISLATIDYSANTVNWLDSTVSADLIGDTSPQLGGMLDVNGNAIGDGVLELLKFIETASAVNELTITNSATTNAPELSSTGDDTNIDIKITPKGSGNVVLDGIKFPNADGTVDQVLKTDGSGNLSFTDVSGGISWQSSIVTGSTLTAVAGNGYWIDTTLNACTITLPASASVGDQIIFVDYARTWGTNAITINTNSLNFQGDTSPNPEYNTDGQSVSIVYSGATQGWIPTVDDDVTYETPPTYDIDFLVIAGGGGGGANIGGGGGAGGYRTSTQSVAPGTTITVTVGDGGAGSLEVAVKGTSGSNSSISGTGLTTITSAGGGGGGSIDAGTGVSGGSGGGSARDGIGGGLGNTPSTSPSQGNNGGTGQNTAPSYGAGGGGGAGAVGVNGTSTTGGNGGVGTASSITGSSVTRAGGGGGGSEGGTAGTGSNGGGNGINNAGTASAATVNTGSGGGGGGYASPSGGDGGAGGKGVVILSMPDAEYSTTTTGSPTVATGVSGKTVLTFTGSGSYTA